MALPTGQAAMFIKQPVQLELSLYMYLAGNPMDQGDAKNDNAFKWGCIWCIDIFFPEYYAFNTESVYACVCV